MPLRRIGNKKKLAAKIISYFPKHTLYIEPFFGGGGLFFSKPLAKYNYVNDIDADVINLFRVVTENQQEFYNAVELVPYSKDVFNYLKSSTSDDSIKKAVRFVVLSNWSYLGKSDVLNLSLDNNKKILLQNIQKTVDFLLKGDIKFNNCDFRVFLSEFSFRDDSPERQNAFIYCDPPYVDTNDNYSNSFKESDFCDLLKVLIDSKIRFAISEFKTDLVIEKAKEYNLRLIDICERQSLKNRNTEILLVNYETNKTLFE